MQERLRERPGRAAVVPERQGGRPLRGQSDMGWADGHGVLTRSPTAASTTATGRTATSTAAAAYEAPDGSWYEGQWKKGKPHGQGQYRRPDGKIFIGEWIDGVYEGDVEPGTRRQQRSQPNLTTNERDQESSACLLGRTGHLGHPEVAAGHLPVRGRHLHRRHRPGRGAGAGASQGAEVRREGNLHRRPARGIRARLRVPDVPRQCHLRGRIPARHQHRAPADRQAPDRDRAAGRRRCGRRMARPARATIRCASSSATTPCSRTSA